MRRTVARHPLGAGRQRVGAILLVAAVLACLPALAVQANSGTIIYVDVDADGANDGGSWTDAYTDLQTALGVANSDDEIWVAKGTYTPGTDRIDTFQLKNGVGLYGGYPSGGGPRDWANNETTLSGDIGTRFLEDNCYHVVTGSGTDATAVLDGFTVSGGTADDFTLNNSGGGMYNNNGSPTVENCTFSLNVVVSRGGGMYNWDNSSPTVTNCTFSGNTASEGGGMSNLANSSPTVENCTFSGNAAPHYGGGMSNEFNSSPTVENCTFSGNHATLGGGMYNDSSSPTVRNCTFSGNTASVGGGMCNEYNSDPTVTNCTFSGNEADTGGGMYNVDNSSPTVKNTIIADNPSSDECFCDGDSSITSDGYNLDSDGSCITDGVNHDRTVSEPLLGDLQDNGGPTETHVLLAGSPAIDAGSCDVATDQRGVGRPQPAGAADACDIGAVEMHWYILTLTKGGTETGTVTSVPVGIDCGGSCDASYTEGTQVTLTATPDLDSLFTGWGGDASGSDPSVIITMNDDRDVTAEFISAATLTVDGAGTGSGSVTGAGIDCTITAGTVSGDGSERIAVGSAIDLTATPAYDSLFAGWSGDASGSDPSVTITMNDDRDVTAEFIPAATLTVDGAGTGSGSVTGAGIDCTITAGTVSGDGSERIAVGSAIDLTATPAADSLFGGWSGDASGSDPSVTVTLDDAKTVVASFTLRPYTTGDVNGDAAIDLLDVRLCARIAHGYLAGTPSQRAAADVDGDGDVDADDVTILSEYVLGARPTLP